MNKAIILSIPTVFLIGLIGCSSPDSDLKIISSNVVIHDDMSQLEVCFNRPIESSASFISDIKVTTLDGYTFGRSDMSITGNKRNGQGTCAYEAPYIFLRNTRDDNLRRNFSNSFKPNNIKSIQIKLGTVPVQFSYSDDFKLTEYKKVF